MSQNPVIMVIMVLVLGGFIFSLYPYIEGLMVNVGEEMATGANYTVTTTQADQTKDTLWGVGGAILVLSLMMIVFLPMMQRGQQHPGM